MKMFILGAVCFYVVTSLIGFALDELNILDNWDFGQIYTQLIPLIVSTPFAYVKNLYVHRDYYKIMIKNGLFFKKYEYLKNIDTKILREIQDTNCGFPVRSYIDTILKDRGEPSHFEYKRLK